MAAYAIPPASTAATPVTLMEVCVPTVAACIVVGTIGKRKKEKGKSKRRGNPNKKICRMIKIQ